MMVSYNFDLNKAVATVAYIATRLKEQDILSDYYKIFKILYFADQKHLVKYGRPVVGDYYCALPNGPAPQNIYDLIKDIMKPDRPYKKFENPERYFSVHDKFVVTPVSPPDMDELSESDIECLDASFQENANLSFDELKDKSHGEAFKKAHIAAPINFLDIAAEGGASDELIETILEEAEDEGIFDRVVQIGR